MKALALIILSSFLHTHDGLHDDWLKSLRNGNKQSCCVGSEAFSVQDPDWEMNGTIGTYRVRQSTQHQWLTVPKEALVTDVNRLGTAMVWPTYDASGTWTSIRCFMPGSAI